MADTAHAKNGVKERLKPYRWGPKIDRTISQNTKPPVTDMPQSSSINVREEAKQSESKVVPPSEEGIKKPRRSRFSAESSDGSAAGNAAATQPAKPIVVSPEVLQQTMLLQMKLKLVNDRIMTVAQDAIARDKNPNRSPSPPPKYDALGKRVNTTEVWMRENLMQERNDLIEQMVRINPLYTPPADYVKPKPYRTLPIPQRQYPHYNFIGLIIGPRGNTQKRMEMETGTKISIRGKGSVKEGSKGRANKNVDESDDLHVHITGDDEQKVILATKMVAELLCPIDDDKNEHKQKQLKELVRSLRMPLLNNLICTF